jgi:DNA replication ATP-dependent helicase Dna2
LTDVARSRQGLYLVGGAAALSAPRPAPPEDEAVAQGRADISDGASCDMEYDFLLCATDPASLAAAAAAAAAQDDGPDASGAVPATLGDAGADAAPAVAAAAGALPPAALALLGRFGAGDRVLLSLAPLAGAPAADVTVLARACVARVAPPPASGPGVPATAVALLTLRCRRAIAVPARCGDAGSMAWRADRDDGAGLVTRMRATVWALVQQPPPCRLRELVAELAPPGLQAPAPPRPEEASAVAAAASLEAALNAEQRGAVDAVLCAHDFSLLRGLPGTGKTATLCAAVAALVARGASVLLACHTHSALDNALSRLQAAGVPGLLRLGDPARAAPAVRALCLGGAAWPDAAGGGDAARVVGATCHACGSHPLLARRRFHVAVLDEAAQVPLPLALAPLCRADAFVLVGDPAQLPPLWAAPAARAGGGEESLFARLATAHPSSVASLTVQYRMAEDVQAVANALVYGGALRCGNEATAQRRYVLPMAPPQSAPAWVRAALCPSVRVALLDTDALGPAAAEATRPLRNTGEAALAAAIAAAAVAAGAPVGSLALMTPYNAQVEALQAACAAAGLPAGAVETTTVDRAQGRDLPAVVLSCVRTAVAAPGGDEQQPAVNLLDDARRLCVALTRAQGKMLILASVKALRAQPLTAQLVDFCAQRSWLVTLPPDALQ